MNFLSKIIITSLFTCFCCSYIFTQKKNNPCRNDTNCTNGVLYQTSCTYIMNGKQYTEIVWRCPIPKTNTPQPLSENEEQNSSITALYEEKYAVKS